MATDSTGRHPNEETVDTAIRRGQNDKVSAWGKKFGYDWNPAPWRKEETLFFRAIEHGNESLPVIEGWLADGVITADTLNAPLSGNEDGARPLHIAVAKHSERTIRMLVRNGADINAVDAKGNPPLFKGSAYLAPELIGLGADPEARNHNGDTMVHAFVNKGNAAVTTNDLIGKYPHIAVLKNKDGKSPLARAFLNKTPKICDALVDAGCRPDELWVQNGTPDSVIHVLLEDYEQKIGMLRWLAKHDFPFNAVSRETAVSVMDKLSGQGHWELFSELRKKAPSFGLSPEGKGEAWKKAITRHDFRKTAIALLNAGYDFDGTDEELARPFLWTKKPDAVKVLTHKRFKPRKDGVCSYLWGLVSEKTLFPDDKWNNSVPEGISRSLGASLDAGFVPQDEHLALLASAFVTGINSNGDRRRQAEKIGRLFGDESFDAIMPRLFPVILEKSADRLAVSMESKGTGSEYAYGDTRMEIDERTRKEAEKTLDFLLIHREYDFSSVPDAIRRRVAATFPGRIACAAEPERKWEHLPGLVAQTYDLLILDGDANDRLSMEYQLDAFGFSEDRKRFLETFISGYLEHFAADLPDDECREAASQDSNGFTWLRQNVVMLDFLKRRRPEDKPFSDRELAKRLKTRYPGEVEGMLDAEEFIDDMRKKHLPSSDARQRRSV